MVLAVIQGASRRHRTLCRPQCEGRRRPANREVAAERMLAVVLSTSCDMLMALGAADQVSVRSTNDAESAHATEALRSGREAEGREERRVGGDGAAAGLHVDDAVGGDVDDESNGLGLAGTDDHVVAWDDQLGMRGLVKVGPWKSGVVAPRPHDREGWCAPRGVRRTTTHPRCRPSRTSDGQ